MCPWRRTTDGSELEEAVLEPRDAVRMSLAASTSLEQQPPPPRFIAIRFSDNGAPDAEDLDSSAKLDSRKKKVDFGVDLSPPQARRRLLQWWDLQRCRSSSSEALRKSEDLDLGFFFSSIRPPSLLICLCWRSI